MPCTNIDPQIKQLWQEYVVEISPAWAKYQKAFRPAQQKLQDKHITESAFGIPYLKFLKDIQPASEHLKQKVADFRARDQLAAVAKAKGWAIG